jgi:hypothetical protein
MPSIKTTPIPVDQRMLHDSSGSSERHTKVLECESKEEWTSWIISAEYVLKEGTSTY